MGFRDLFSRIGRGTFFCTFLDCVITFPMGDYIETCPCNTYVIYEGRISSSDVYVHLALVDRNIMKGKEDPKRSHVVQLVAFAPSRIMDKKYRCNRSSEVNSG